MLCLTVPLPDPPPRHILYPAAGGLHFEIHCREGCMPSSCQQPNDYHRRPPDQRYTGRWTMRGRES
jgi:hypothetical protein